jgi:carboxypeptidase Taq
MNKTKGAYEKLHDLSRHIAILSSVYQLLEWDQETYLPSDAIFHRARQIETMASLIHKEKTSARFAKALQELIDIETGEILNTNLSSAQIAALKEWRRDHLKTVKLPSSFVKTFAQTTSQATHIWAIAKKTNDFALFAPYLEKIVNLCRKKADFLGFKEHPYDALLDLFEPEMTTSFLIPLFSKLRISLSELLKMIGTQPIPSDSFLHGEFSHARQMRFAEELLKAMGFQRSSSRLDESNHPFCNGIAPKDTRMTTRINPDALMNNIFAVLHEGGHGLYHQDLPEDQYGSPLAESISLGIDESQSRFWETLIGHSLPFWKCFYPKLQKEFSEKLSGIHINEFYRAINIVRPSFIRIHADEVTYSLHIILRFELEKALIEGQLKVKDVPQMWNERMRDYLGISPQDNSIGCLQDIHWSMGAFGYFPTYTLGNLYAAQIFEAFERAYSGWRERVETGDLLFIRNWLASEIHRYGRQFTPHQLIVKVTGKALSEAPYIHYLHRKFTALYHLE